MSEIQRYELITNCNNLGPWAPPEMHYQENGKWVLYTDLLWYRRQYHMAVVALVLVCAAFASYLVIHKHDPQPVKQVAVEAPWQELSNRMDQLIETHNQATAVQRKAEMEYRRREQDRAKLIANLEAQIKAQNQLLTPQQQTETLKVAAQTMKNDDVVKLAAEMGMKVRVRE